MDKNKVKHYLKLMQIELTALFAMDAINEDTFDLLSLNINEIKKEIAR